MKALITLLILCSTAMAEPKYTPSIIPSCVVRDVGKDKGCVYDLEQVKALYRADAELVASRSEILLLTQKETLLGSVIAKNNEQLLLSLKNVKLFKDRNEELTTKLIATDKELQYEKAKPVWGNYIVWGAVVAVTAAFGGYIIADQVAK